MTEIQQEKKILRIPAPCKKCDSAIFWQAPSEAIGCAVCNPPPTRKILIRKMLVVVADPSGGWGWEEFIR